MRAKLFVDYQGDMPDKINNQEFGPEAFDLEHGQQRMYEQAERIIDEQFNKQKDMMEMDQMPSEPQSLIKKFLGALIYIIIGF